MTPASRQRLLLTLGSTGLVLMVAGCLTALGTGLISTVADVAWVVSQAGAVLAFAAGLTVRGRRATFAFVVPSLVYLLLIMGPV